MNEPTAPVEYSGWLTTSQAAAALGVAERTVQRRCKSGKLAARQVTTGDGLEWRIDPATVPTGAAIGADTGDKVPTQVATPIYAQNDAETVQSVGSVPTGAAIVPTGAAIVPTGDDTGGDTPNVAELLAQSREEIVFLRGLIEQRDRDAAELRAALREALRAMPKALSESTPDAAKLEQVGTGNESREDAPQTPQNNEAANHKGEVVSARNRRHSGEMRPLWKVILGIR